MPTSTHSSASRSTSRSGSGRRWSRTSGSSSRSRGRPCSTSRAGPEWARWFVGGRLNLAWNCVHRWAGREGEAAVWQPEDGGRRALSWAELSREVYLLAEGLAALGIGEGDVVGTFLPMAPEVAIASHALAHLGAVQVPIFSGFAAHAIAARLADAGATALITADGSLRRGQVVPMKEIADEALLTAPSVERVVVWRRLGTDVPVAGGTRRLLGRARRGTHGRRRAGGGRLGGAVPARVHLRHDRPAEGRAPRPGRLPRLGRARGGLPVGRPRRRPRPLRHRHGLDHGAVDRGRGRRGRGDRRLRGGRARLARRPALAARRVGARDDARRLAHARAGADPEGRARGRPLLAAGDHDDRRAVEPRARTCGSPSTSAAAASRSSTSPAAPRSAPASSRRASWSRSSRSRSGFPRSEQRWTCSTPTADRCAARSASSSAGGPGRG